MGRQFFEQTQRGVLAYVITRPLMAAISVLANMANVYCEGEFHKGCVWPYVALINSTSQMWALYCLVLLYEATKRELEKIRPLPEVHRHQICRLSDILAVSGHRNSRESGPRSLQRLVDL